MRPLAVGILMAVVARGGSPSHEQFTVRIFDYAPVPSATLQQALLESQGIFRKAGIETTWLTCRPFSEENQACAPILPAQTLVKIVPRSADKQMLASGAFGCALRSKEAGFATYVFYEPVERAAHSAPFDPAVLLGMVLTHELGHFFGLNDSLGGIMLAGFRRMEMMQAASGSLSFDKDQAKRLRRSIDARARQLK